jgi:hypothetical protein
MVETPLEKARPQVAELKERSDFDPHQSIKRDKLGEDWGDGFFVNPEPVVIERDARGQIQYTIPLSEYFQMRQSQPSLPAVRAPLHISPTRKTIPQIDQIAGRMAADLLKWYMARPPSPSMFNPVYDGIPTCNKHPEGCAFGCPPEYQTGIIQATTAELYLFLKRIIGQRVEIRKAKSGISGWRPDLGDRIILRR